MIFFVYVTSQPIREFLPLWLYRKWRLTTSACARNPSGNPGPEQRYQIKGIKGKSPSGSGGSSIVGELVTS